MDKLSEIWNRADYWLRQLQMQFDTFSPDWEQIAAERDPLAYNEWRNAVDEYWAAKSA